MSHVEHSQMEQTMTTEQHDLSHIAEGLRPLAVPIASLHLDPANARRHPARNLDTIKASLAKNGQVKNVVVQRQGMVVRCGNGTIEAAKALGWTHVAALVLDQSDVEATLLAIADNRSSELADWDLPVLATLLEAFDAPSRELVGFSQADLDSVLKQLQPFTPQVNPQSATGAVTDGDVQDAAEDLDGQFAGQTPKLEVCCPDCGKVFQVDSPTGKDGTASTSSPQQVADSVDDDRETAEGQP